MTEINRADAERRSIEAMRQREQIRASGAVSAVRPAGLMIGDSLRRAYDEAVRDADEPEADWQIVSGWLVEIGEDGEPVPMAELSSLPGYQQWVDSLHDEAPRP